MMFKYDPNISLGTIIETIVLLGVVIGCYVSLVGNDVRHDERINAQAFVIESVRQDLRDIKEGNKQIQSAVFEVKVEQARVQQQLAAIKR